VEDEANEHEQNLCGQNLSSLAATKQVSISATVQLQAVSGVSLRATLVTSTQPSSCSMRQRGSRSFVSAKARFSLVTR
jgi:hypothetical protein